MSRYEDFSIHKLTNLTRVQNAQLNKPPFGSNSTHRPAFVAATHPPPDHYTDAHQGIGSRFIRKEQAEEMKQFVTQKTTKSKETYFVKERGMITQQPQRMAIDKLERPDNALKHMLETPNPIQTIFPKKEQARTTALSVIKQ